MGEWCTCEPIDVTTLGAFARETLVAPDPACPMHGTPVMIVPGVTLPPLPIVHPPDEALPDFEELRKRIR